MKKKVLTAEEAHVEIERTAKEKAVQEIRTIEKIERGQFVRQGDIYIHRVYDDHPRGAKLESHQLALGDSTGSRHIAEAPADCFTGIRPPGGGDVQAFLGPLIVSLERFTVTHPEHAHFSLPAGTYQVVHQLDGRTRQRAID